MDFVVSLFSWYGFCIFIMKAINNIQDNRLTGLEVKVTHLEKLTYLIIVLILGQYGISFI